MERGEPTLVPEWYKGSGGSVSGGSGFNHHSRSSSGELGIGLSPRSRLLVSACNRDSPPRSSFFTDKSSSPVRNSSLSLDKDATTHLRPYSSFGRSNRGRDREKDLDLFDRDRSLLLGNGFCNMPKSSSTEKTTLTHSRSMVSGRPAEWPTKKPVKDINKGTHSGGSVISGISKASFERDFPSLGAEDKQFHSELSRISSSGPSTAIQSLPTGASAVGNDWTSPLAQAPNKVGGNGPVHSSALQTAPVSLTSIASSTTMGLNMAEALLQGPSRVRNTPQVSVDAQRKDELTRIQYTKLIPVRPSMSKSSILNTTDKSKSKAAKDGDVSAPLKVRQQPSSQLVNQAPTTTRSDIPKTSQAGNFLVLNRERNGSLHAAKDGHNLINGSGIATPVSGVSSVIAPERSINPKVKVDIKGDIFTSTQRTFGEKRPLSQARNRNDFFNSLRKKTYGNQPAATEPSCIAPAYVSDKLCPQNVEISSSSSLQVTGNQEAQKFTPDNTGKSFCSESTVDLEEEEAAFLRSLGWEENMGEEALTAEEIDAFVKEYEKRRPSSKLSDRELWTLKAVRGVPNVVDEAGSSSAWSMSGSEQEA